MHQVGDFGCTCGHGQAHSCRETCRYTVGFQHLCTIALPLPSSSRDLLPATGGSRLQHSRVLSCEHSGIFWHSAHGQSRTRIFLARRYREAKLHGEIHERCQSSVTLRLQSRKKYEPPKSPVIRPSPPGSLPLDLEIEPQESKNHRGSMHCSGNTSARESIAGSPLWDHEKKEPALAGACQAGAASHLSLQGEGTSS